MKSHRASGAAIVVCAALLVNSAPLRAQEAQRDEAPLYSSRVELMRLHVGVRDGDAFVPGLTAADFRLTVDDRDRPLAWVEEIDLGVGADGTAAGTGRTPAGDATIGPAQLDSPRHFVIFLDAIFQHPAKLLVARTAAAEFLRTMTHPGDLVALAVAGYDGISLLEPFTADVARVRRRMDTVESEWTWEVRAAMGRDRTFFADPYDHPLPRRAGRGVPRGFELLPDLLPGYNHSVVDLVGLYLSGLRELGMGLQALEGRKHLLLYSPGFASRLIGIADIRGISDRAPAVAVAMALDYTAQDLRELMFLAAEALRDSDTVVHVLSTSRLQPGGGRAGMQSVWYFSDETHGSMAFDTHHLEPATARVNARTSRYYTLAYRRRPEDGARVTISVSVARPGLEVEAPTRLVLPPADAEMTPLQLRLSQSEERAQATRISGLPTPVR